MLFRSAGLAGMYVRGGNGDDNLYMIEGNPLYPSGTSRKIYVLAFIFLSVCIVIFWKLFGEDILNKFKEIRA